MPFHLYKACKENEPPHWFGIRVEFEDDRWAATCREVDEQGDELPDAVAVAPKFYGVTAEQAHRRMVTVLENTYDELTPASMQN